MNENKSYKSCFFVMLLCQTYTLILVCFLVQEAKNKFRVVCQFFALRTSLLQVDANFQSAKTLLPVA